MVYDNSIYQPTHNEGKNHKENGTKSQLAEYHPKAEENNNYGSGTVYRNMMWQDQRTVHVGSACQFVLCLGR